MTRLDSFESAVAMIQKLQDGPHKAAFALRLDAIARGFYRLVDAVSAAAKVARPNK
jgi:hypothetical protein